MKQILFATLFSTMTTLLLTGCNKSDTASKGAVPTSQSTFNDTPAPLMLNDAPAALMLKAASVPDSPNFCPRPSAKRQALVDKIRLAQKASL